MRISDWSSDVCSSDLTQYRIPAFARFDGWYTLNANLREEDFGAFDNSRTIEVAANRNARFGDWGVTVGAWGQQQSFSELDAPRTITTGRSEEQTSELQSIMRITNAVFCLKKNKKYQY